MIPRIGAGIGVVFSDVHIPDQDDYAVGVMCDLIVDLDPSFLVADGDIFDLAEFSSHERGSAKHFGSHRLVDTWRAGEKFFNRVDGSVTRRCKRKVFLAGNHENRWERWVSSGDNAVFDGDEALSIQHRMNFDERGWEFDMDYPDAHVMAGKLLITHGQYANVHCAKKHLDEYQCSILVGHTHTDQTYHGSTYEGQRVAHCQGLMANIEASSFKYKRRPRRWVKGFSVVRVTPSDNFFIQPIRFVEGQIAFGGKVYGRYRKAS